MKKILMALVLFLCTFSLFAQETDNTYWYEEKDVGGRLLTYYFCKTDAQFDNTFKDIVKDKLGIVSYQKPNWNSIKDSIVSVEYIKNNYPKFYEGLLYDIIVGLLYDIIVNLDNYKYCWCIQNVDGMYLVSVAKRINGTVYISLSAMYGHYQWTYTLETLKLFESD